MDDFSLLIDLHKAMQRQGPGGQEVTSKAMELADLSHVEPLRIADIGCGTGASTLQLAQSLNAEITAVDFLPEFIEVLQVNAAAAGLSDSIKPLVCSMDALPFTEREYDVLWSEGAIYNMGFERGVKAWRPFLKPGGLLIVSEITWTSDRRPLAIQQYWDEAYPEIDTASSKMSVLEKSGYAPLAYFTLPENSWMENYYRPLQNSFPGFLTRHPDNEDAVAIVEAEKEEIALYERYKSFYSYGMYIARKVD